MIVCRFDVEPFPSPPSPVLPTVVPTIFVSCDLWRSNKKKREIGRIRETFPIIVRFGCIENVTKELLMRKIPLRRGWNLDRMEFSANDDPNAEDIGEADNDADHAADGDGGNAKGKNNRKATRAIQSNFF